MTELVIRVDSGPGIGGGHLARCVALAEAMRCRGWRVRFACRAEALEVSGLFKSNDWPTMVVHGSLEEEAARLAMAIPEPVDFLLVDHYGRDAAFERACRTFARKIAVLDDEPGERAHDADLLIDGALGRGAEDWRPFAGARARILVGAEFALVRNDVLEERARALALRRGPEVRRVLIGFGLSDRRDVTSRVIGPAREVFPGAAIDVVVGRTAPHRDAVARTAAGAGAAFHVEPDDYLHRLATADLAIGAGGVSAIERACLGVPSVAVETAANQHFGLKALADSGATVLAGRFDSLDATRLKNAMRAAAANLSGLSARAAGLIDGRGTDRVADQFVCIARASA